VRIPDAVCGELAQLLREAVTARLLAERCRLARPGERAWNAGPWLLLAARFEAAGFATESPGFTPALVDVETAAKAAGVSSQTIRNRCRSGRINALRHAGRWLIVAEGDWG
jgi:hypothetical protein